MLYLICHFQIEGCENNVGKCNWDVNSDSCGPFQIKDVYYIDCYKPGTSNLLITITYLYI